MLTVAIVHYSMTPWEAFNKVGKTVWHVKVSIKVRKRRLVAASPNDTKCHIGPVDPLYDADRTYEKLPADEVFESKLDAYKHIVHKLGTHIKAVKRRIRDAEKGTHRKGKD
jgi:hypothetical protein